MSFKEIGDNELLYLIRCENFQAKETLIDRYKIRIYGMIKTFANKHKIKNINFEDYYQTCYLTFNNCLKLYDDNYNFRNYLNSAIENAMIKILGQEEAYQEILSLDNDVYDRDIFFLDKINESTTLYLTNEIEEFLDKNLQPLERKIVELKMKGYKTNDIALILGMNGKDIYKKMIRIKRIIGDKYVEKSQK